MKSGLVTAAMMVAAIRLWMQLRGKTKTPFVEWAIGWGATFFVLALLGDAAPTAATMLAWIIVVSDFLVNGVSLTNDISAAIVGSEKGTPVFTEQPFANTAKSGKVGG